MIIWRSCGWCHTLNASTETTCSECGHDANKPRLHCACPKCRHTKRPNEVRRREEQRAAYDAAEAGLNEPVIDRRAGISTAFEIICPEVIELDDLEDCPFCRTPFESDDPGCRWCDPDDTDSSQYSMSDVTANTAEKEEN
jgi:hypothetical protein